GCFADLDHGQRLLASRLRREDRGAVHGRKRFELRVSAHSRHPDVQTRTPPLADGGVEYSLRPLQAKRPPLDRVGHAYLTPIPVDSPSIPFARTGSGWRPAGRLR